MMRLPLMACIVATTGVTFFAATRSIDAMAISQPETDAQVQDLSAKAELKQAEEKYREKISALEAANKDQVADHAKLVSDLAQARSAFTDLQTEHDALLKTQEALQVTSASTEEQAAAWDQKLADAQVKITDLVTKLDTSEAKIKTLETQLASAKLDAAKAAKRIVALESAAALTRQNMPSNAELVALQETVVAKDAALGASADRIAALTRVLERNANQARTEAAKAAQLQTQVSDLDAQVSNLDAKVSTVSLTLAERDSELAQLRAQLPVDPQITVADCTAQTENLLTQGAINFNTGTSRLDHGSVTLVEQLADLAKTCVAENLFVTIGGHTDSLGGEANNQELSKKRAAEIVKVFTERGVAATSLRVVGYGETQPIADNETNEGRAANRRITFEWQPS